MEKFLLATLLASAMAVGASAEVRVTAVPIGEKPISTPAKAVSTAEVLVYEDFSKWTEGTVENPAYDYSLTYFDDRNIDPDLMNDEMQWEGYKVYSAGGTCALRTFDAMSQAYINTPKGDYSGSVKVTFLAKYLPVYWEEDGTTYHWSGSHLNVGLYTDDYKDFVVGENDGNPNALVSNLALYPEFGWYEVTLEFDNFTAYNDAYLSFFCSNGIMLDNIKVTSSVDNFIAAPIIEDITEVSETSFTVNVQPVRKAYDYYFYLFELQGYDEETGEPVYMPLPNPEDFSMMQEYLGPISYKEYWQMYFGLTDEAFNTPWYLTSPYCMYAFENTTSFTYTDLDPEKQYYYAVCAHYLHTFSPMEIHPMNEIAAPEVKAATDITSNSFTANWSAIAKADSYEVNLYGVNRVVEDSDNFIIFEEDFDNVGAFTTATDIYDPDVVDPESGITLDDLISSPGWYIKRLNHLLLVDGMLGLDDYNYWLFTPDLYVAVDDKIIVTIRAEFISEDPIFYVKFAGTEYQVPVQGNVFEGEIELPTNGLDLAQLQISGPDYDYIYLDYIVVSQSLKKGDLTYTYLATEATESTSLAFNGLDADRFDLYGYAVQAVRGEESTAIYSQPSERMFVDLKNGDSSSVVTAIDTVDVVEVERYNLEGKKLTAPTKGLNIIRMSDGSVRKVMVK